jgi:hypothetical protein
LQFRDDLGRCVRGTLVATGALRENIAMATSSVSSSSTASNGLTASEWTQQSMLSDLMQQKGLLIGLGVVVGLFLLLSRRSAPEEKAARRLVRDWRHVDDPDDARELLGQHVPTIIRPVLLAVLDEVERQVHRVFRSLERQIEGR